MAKYAPVYLALWRTGFAIAGSELVQQLLVLDAAAAELGCTLEHPCMTLSFLSLSVIPSLKLTDQGLIDVETFTLSL